MTPLQRFGHFLSGLRQDTDPKVYSRRADLDTRADRLKATPKTRDGWQERYDWLDSWWLGEPYGAADVKPLRLFKAVDDNGKLIAQAERLVQDAQFIVDTDARTLGGGRWSLEVPRDGSAGLLAAGMQTWRRNRIQGRKTGALTTLCSKGDVGIEATDDGRMIFHDPRQYTVYYEGDGFTMREALIFYTMYDDEGRPRVYRRRLTRETIETWEEDEDGNERRADNTPGRDVVPHSLGVVPFAHIVCTPITGCPEHGLWAGHRMELPMAAMDSFIAQTAAIATRYAHPHLVVKGARVRGSDDVEQFGRVFDGVPMDADISYLEAGMGALQPLREILHDYQDRVRGTIPEFTLAGSGANTSGRALEFRADQLRRKLRDLRTRVFEGFADATLYASLLRTNGQHDPDAPGFRIKGPPILPIDESTRSAVVLGWAGAGKLTDEDVVKHGQALGLIDDEEDPEDYAARLPTADAPPPPDLDSDQ